MLYCPLNNEGTAECKVQSLKQVLGLTICHRAGKCLIDPNFRPECPVVSKTAYKDTKCDRPMLRHLLEGEKCHHQGHCLLTIASGLIETHQQYKKASRGDPEALRIILEKINALKAAA